MSDWIRKRREPKTTSEGRLMDHLLERAHRAEDDVTRLEQKCEALEEAMVSVQDGTWEDYETVKRERDEAREALRLEQAAHGHRRICPECQEPDQPSNGCPRWREMAEAARAALAPKEEAP